MEDWIHEGRALLAAGKAREADEHFERALAAAPAMERPRLAAEAGRAALKEGHPLAAVRWYRRAGELAPRDPEPRHDRGLAHLEAGEVGLAAQAQAEALALDPDHPGARAQRAAALEALGDDEGAARELDRLLERLGPQPSLEARLIRLRESARRTSQRRLVGGAGHRLQASPLVGTALAAPVADGRAYRAPFGELRAETAGGRISRLTFMFDSMDASLARTDVVYGGTTEDEHGRRVPLDEFTSAGVVFFSEALGIEPVRARRVLRWLLTPECGLGPHPIGGVLVGWVIEGANGDRRYGLFAAQP